ncbi:MAG: hypothetical protein IIV97_02320 [Oscillospiraceae bacterium]|nr:hypothetical protein [Oscillospiraceae bacterium]
MVSCTEFIPLYSELFKYLEDLGGHDEVVRYWEHISDTYVSDRLGEEASKNGILGCWNYWNKSLNEEACDFDMDVDEEAGTFKITMHHCPSKGRLNDFEHMEPYYDYCGHCDLLYSRQLEKHGIYPYESDYSEVDKAKCVVGYKIDPKFAKCSKEPQKLHITRSDADNEYFHRDFHVSAKNGVEYVGNKFGDRGVEELLTRFAKAYYSPLAAKVKNQGLAALKEQIEEVYKIEKAPENVECTLTDKELSVKVSACPGVTYIKSTGKDPSKWYVELTRTVNRTIAEMCGIGFEFTSYNEENGACEYRYFIK